MRSLLVLVFAPVRGDHSRFAERVHQPAVQALREIGIEAMDDKKVHDMVMAIRDAVVGEK